MPGTIINTRVDPDIIEDAESILKTLGISRSVAINMFYRMVVLKKGLPWKPNLDETEYIMNNPKLAHQIEQSMQDFEEENFSPAPQSVLDEINSLQ